MYWVVFHYIKASEMNKIVLELVRELNYLHICAILYLPTYYIFKNSIWRIFQNRTLINYV